MKTLFVLPMAFLLATASSVVAQDVRFNFDKQPAEWRVMDNTDEIGYWLQVVRGEYLEVPGLRLTRRQVQRLWGWTTSSARSFCWRS